MVVNLNAGTRVWNAKIKTQKETSRQALAFHFSARTANGQTIASRGNGNEGSKPAFLAGGQDLQPTGGGRLSMLVGCSYNDLEKFSMILVLPFLIAHKPKHV